MVRQAGELRGVDGKFLSRDLGQLDHDDDEIQFRPTHKESADPFYSTDTPFHLLPPDVQLMDMKIG